jgi:hypothetical protein
MFRRVFTLLAVAITLHAATASAQSYPVAEIRNNSPYPVSGTVEYVSALCSNDRYSVGAGQIWRAGSRGLCLIRNITGAFPGGTPPRNGETMQVASYTSSGTSYAVFRIEAFGDRYRIFSLNEFAQNSRTDSRQSPGFRFVNDTPWPVAFSLDQVGCLYHDVIPARDPAGNPGVMVRSTGAVWFTLRMHIQPDGVNPQTDWDCAEPVVELVGDVALAALTGGAGAAAAAPKFVAKQVAKEAIKAAVKTSVKELAKNGAQQIGRYLVENGSISMGGQYAGYDWPFRCDAMPEYRITGGPGIARTEEGEIYLLPGPPFTVAKTNTCGDDMMRASPKRQSKALDIAGFFSAADAGGEAGSSAGAVQSGAQASASQHAAAQLAAPTAAPPAARATASHPAGNVAAGKRAAQSSTILGGDASRAVDGRSDGSWSNGSVTHTDREPGAWWMVDLGAEHLITGIVVHNRTDCCSERLAASVVVTQTEGWPSGSVVFQEQLGTPHQRIDIPVASRGAIYGRYVYIVQHGAEYLSLSEVQVTGSPRSGGGGQLFSDDVNGRNLARVDHDGGSFRQIGDKQWAEYTAQGAAAYNFVETARDDWSVFLIDRSRNVEIQLDVHRKMIGYAPVGQPRGDLYRITRVYRQ